MPNYICDNCGEKFKRKSALCERKFCTRKCFGQYFSKTYMKEKAPRWAGGKVTSVCRQCGNDFLQDPHQVGVRVNCSRKCVNNYRKTLVGERSPFWKGGGVGLICKSCGKTFDRSKSAVLRGRGIFCSKQCHIEHQKTLVRELSNQWKGGKWHRGYPTSFNRRIREEIRKRDNYSCQGCEVVEADIVKKFNRRLAVHHIDYDRENLAYTNLITTCYACNNKANRDREYWKQFYTNKISLL